MLFKTRSICPECFAVIDAAHVLDLDSVYLVKTCDVHGVFKTKIWQGEETYKHWIKPKIPIVRRFGQMLTKKGCPFDCGLCPDHRQHTCTAVLEVTHNCNCHCDFCFAGSGSARTISDPSLEHIANLLTLVYKTSSGCNLQISGGEPTLRQDLPEIIACAKKTGFEFIQLNTNGIVAAQDSAYLKDLKQAGLSSVFLQFDGLSDTVYQRLRHRPMRAIKQQAILNCIENEIGVVLVPTLVPGINVNQIGPILFFALDHAPGVRGVHFQPVSYFGRHPVTPKNSDRITIPEILNEIQSQTRYVFCQKDFRPSACEHALCSFNGKFMIMEDGSVNPLQVFNTDCCTPIRAEKGADRAKTSVARQWGAPAKTKELSENCDDLDRFIQRSRTHMFSVSGMAFQDAWNLDLERLKGCCIHSVAQDGRLIPFCAYNLTDKNGKGLYRQP